MDNDARVLPQFPRQLVRAAVDGVDAGCAVGQQHIGKAARRCADVESQRAINVDAEHLERADVEVDTAQRDVVVSLAKLADLPGVRAEVVRMAKENNQAFAKAAVKARQESDARLAEMKGSDDELANEKASATEEQSSLKDYMKRIGIEEDETVAKLLADADKDIANARSAGNAAKQAAACLMGAL